MVELDAEYADDDAFREAWEAERGMREAVARRLGIHSDTVRRRAAKLGVLNQFPPTKPRSGRPRTITNDEVAEAWDRLGGLNAVAKELGAHRETIRRRLKELGIWDHRAGVMSPRHARRHYKMAARNGGRPPPAQQTPWDVPLVTAALRQTRGNLTAAAQQLGMALSTLTGIIRDRRDELQPVLDEIAEENKDVLEGVILAQGMGSGRAKPDRTCALAWLNAKAAERGWGKYNFNTASLRIGDTNTQLNIGAANGNATSRRHFEPVWTVP